MPSPEIAGTANLSPCLSPISENFCAQEHAAPLNTLAASRHDAACGRIDSDDNRRASRRA